MAQFPLSFRWFKNHLLLFFLFSVDTNDCVDDVVVLVVVYFYNAHYSCPNKTNSGHCAAKKFAKRIKQSY